MASVEEKARHRQFSIKNLLSITTAVAICLSIPDWTVFIGFMFALLTSFCLFVAERNQASNIAMIATIVCFLRCMIVLK
jgi:hypothetical protein